MFILTEMFLSALHHPDEILALFKFKFGGCESIMPKCNMVHLLVNTNML